MTFDKSQLMHGILEGCILQIIQKSPTYGYDIVTQLQSNGIEDVREGSIYPLLLRLEKKKWLSAEFKPSPLGPSRKYYALTKDGEEVLQDFKRCWKETSAVVNGLIE